MNMYKLVLYSRTGDRAVYNFKATDLAAAQIDKTCTMINNDRQGFSTTFGIAPSVVPRKISLFDDELYFVNPADVVQLTNTDQYCIITNDQMLLSIAHEAIINEPYKQWLNTYLDDTDNLHSEERIFLAKKLKDITETTNSR